MGHEQGIEAIIGPSCTPYGGGESTSIAPPSPHQDTSSTIATQPWHAQAKVRIIRRLHMCAKRKWGMSKEFRQSGPSYTPYHWRRVDLNSSSLSQLYGGGMSTVDVLPEVWVVVSSIWMHRRDLLKSFLKICNTTHNILIYVASEEYECLWWPSMVVVCQL